MFILNGKSYEGFIKVNGKRYFIQAYLPNYPLLSDMNLKIDWKLKLLIGDALNLLLRCKTSPDIHSLIASVQKLVQEKLGEHRELEPWLQNPLKTHGFFKRLEEEINQVEEYIMSVDVETGLIEIESRDFSFRVHKATLKISYNYQKEPIKVVSHDLPIQENGMMRSCDDLKNVTSVAGFCKKFNHYINVFQDFWNEIAAVDANCWVLDPENPSYKDITRRIKISDSLSVVLTFNPHIPRQRPDIQFLGCQSSVDEIKEILQRNLEEEIWDEDFDLLYNLNNILEVTLPGKPEKNENETVDLINPGECAICFMVRLDNEIPTLICDNTNCMSEYHAQCLFKYFRSIPTNKNYFGRMQGDCPNCEQVMYCPVPEFS